VLSPSYSEEYECLFLKLLLIFVLLLFPSVMNFYIDLIKVFIAFVSYSKYSYFKNYPEFR
jgi:hypothetical protein